MKFNLLIVKAEDVDGALLGHMLLVAKKVAKEQGAEKGYRYSSFIKISQQKLSPSTWCVHAYILKWTLRVISYLVYNDTLRIVKMVLFRVVIYGANLVYYLWC